MLRVLGAQITNGFKILFSPRYLLFTNTTIGFSLGGGGDFLNQNFEIFRGYKEHWLWSRTRNQCIQGAVFGTTYHFWYIFLDQRFSTKVGGSAASVLMKKLLADQLFMSPISVCLYLCLLNFLEGKDLKQAADSLQKKAYKLLAAEWTFGPAMQLVNFYFLPTRFRVLYDGCVCLAFDAYYTYVKYERNDLVEIAIAGSAGDGHGDGCGSCDELFD